MSISTKIKEEIQKLKIGDNEKEMINEFLTVEDDGVYRYKAKYEEIVANYLKKEKEEEK